MSTIRDREKSAEQDIMEQLLIEEKLAKAKKADKPTVEKKKGQAVEFIPARRVPKLDCPEGFRVAWKHNTPENVRRLQYEGWEVANRVEHNMDVKMGNYYKKLNDSPASKKESTIAHNELIAMLLPEEMAVARAEYHRQETEKQTRSKLRPEDNSSSALMRAAQIKTTMEIN